LLQQQTSIVEINNKKKEDVNKQHDNVTKQSLEELLSKEETQTNTEK